MNQYCFWLLPSIEDKTYLQEIVDRLAKKHSAETFIPHLTLYPFSGIEEQKAKKTLDFSVENINAFHISSTRIFWTKEYFKTVFIEFRINEQLRLLQESFQHKLKKYAEYEFNPHISLLYKNCPLEEKQSIAESLEVKDTFLMDEVVLVDLGKTEQDVFSIANWKIIYSKKL